MINNKKLENYVNTLLNTEKIKDYCPNGLQVEGKKNIRNITTGVSISVELINSAIDQKTDAIFVHHGLFWKNESQIITGIKYKRIELLIKNNINLFAYHLPLDIQESLGNNVALAKILNLTISKTNIFDYGIECKTQYSLKTLIQKITECLKRPPLVVGNIEERKIKKVAICTGAGQTFIEDAHKIGADVYISGEISERTTIVARELKMTYIAAGHHATEKYGILALGNHLEKKFAINHTFINIENPA